MEHAPEGEIAWPDDVIGIEGIDTRLRQAAQALAWRDLELAELARRAVEQGVWQTLRYRSFDHYCRERIGLSPSSMAARVAFARRVGGLGAIADALADGRIGWEAASAIARVAGAANVCDWIARAEVRTVRLLREEIDAIDMTARAEGVPVSALGPPDPETVAQFHALERSVIAAITGGASDDVPQMSGTAEPAGVQTTTLRFSLSEETAAFWRALERLHASPHESFVAFLVRATMKSWVGAMPAAVEYADVYLRDRWRCTSPVCGSRAVTPHHVRFRSQGGGDERFNLVSLCPRCHLELVHSGRVTLRGLAPYALEWRAAGWSAGAVRDEWK